MHKILIVEDDEHLRNAFNLILTSEGFSVEVSVNGEEALKKLKKSKPDLILLDLLMPVMGGLEFLQKANLATDYPSTAVVLCSNVADPIETKDLSARGVTKVVLKSELSPKQLAQVIKLELKSPKKGAE